MSMQCLKQSNDVTSKKETRYKDLERGIYFLEVKLIVKRTRLLHTYKHKQTQPESQLS